MLAAALGGAGALFANALGRANPVAAAAGDPLTLGTANASDLSTSLSSDVEPVLFVHGTNLNTALAVASTSAAGLMAGSVSSGQVRHTGAIAYTGIGNDLAPDTSFTGLYGFSADPENFTAAGVWGDSVDSYGVVGTGYFGVYADGVYGVYGTGSGTGVTGTSRRMRPGSSASLETQMRPTRRSGRVSWGKPGVGLSTGWSARVPRRCSSPCMWRAD